MAPRHSAPYTARRCPGGCSICLRTTSSQTAAGTGAICTLPPAQAATIRRRHWQTACSMKPRAPVPVPAASDRISRLRRPPATCIPAYGRHKVSRPLLSSNREKRSNDRAHLCGCARREHGMRRSGAFLAPMRRGLARMAGHREAHAVSTASAVTAVARIDACVCVSAQLDIYVEFWASHTHAWEGLLRGGRDCRLRTGICASSQKTET